MKLAFEFRNLLIRMMKSPQTLSFPPLLSSRQRRDPCVRNKSHIPMHPPPKLSSRRRRDLCVSTNHLIPKHPPKIVIPTKEGPLRKKQSNQTNLVIPTKERPLRKYPIPHSKPTSHSCHSTEI